MKNLIHPKMLDEAPVNTLVLDNIAHQLQDLNENLLRITDLLGLIAEKRG